MVMQLLTVGTDKESPHFIFSDSCSETTVAMIPVLELHGQ